MKTYTKTPAGATTRRTRTDQAPGALATLQAQRADMSVLKRCQQLADDSPHAVQLRQRRDRLDAASAGGLSAALKSGLEGLSGIGLDDVRVHYDSDRPAQLHAHAYAQGSEIHLAPGQARHLPHEKPEVQPLALTEASTAHAADPFLRPENIPNEVLPGSMAEEGSLGALMGAEKFKPDAEYAGNFIIKRGDRSDDLAPSARYGLLVRQFQEFIRQDDGMNAVRLLTGQ